MKRNKAARINLKRLREITQALTAEINVAYKYRTNENPLEVKWLYRGKEIGLNLALNYIHGIL